MPEIGATSNSVGFEVGIHDVDRVERSRRRRIRISRQRASALGSQLAFAHLPGASSKLGDAIQLWNDEVRFSSRSTGRVRRLVFDVF